MRNISFFLLLIFLFGVADNSFDLHDVRIYVSDIKWQSPSPELHKTYEEGDAEIVLLYKNGDFAYVSATLFRDKSTHQMSICEGCGFSVRKGKWRESGPNGFVETSIWTYQNIPPTVSGKQTSFEASEIKWKIKDRYKDGTPKIIIKGEKRFIPLCNLLNLDLLEKILQTY